MSYATRNMHCTKCGTEIWFIPYENYIEFYCDNINCDECFIVQRITFRNQKFQDK